MDGAIRVRRKRRLPERQGLATFGQVSEIGVTVLHVFSFPCALGRRPGRPRSCSTIRGIDEHERSGGRRKKKRDWRSGTHRLGPAPWTALG